VTSDQNNTGNNQLTANHYPLVTILFWPQYLEFIGFVLLGLAFFRILIIKDNMTNLSHLQIRNSKDDEDFPSCSSIT